jgi:hypothetical protein
MKGANSEEGKTIEYICPEWDVLHFDDTTPILGTHTTEKDGYNQVVITSDTLQSKNIKEGVTIFGITGSYIAEYKLSGRWTINENKLITSLNNETSIINENLAFNVPVGSGYSFIGMSFNNIANRLVLTYGTTTYKKEAYNSISGGWQSEDFLGVPNIIEFTTPQIVPRDFYDWFTSVAVFDVEENTIATTTLTFDGTGYTGTEIIKYSKVSNGAISFVEKSFNIGNTVTVFPDIAANTIIYLENSEGYAHGSAELQWLGDLSYTSSSMQVIFLIGDEAASVALHPDCCFEGASKVLLPNGATKALVDINIGDTVMSYNETTGAIEENKITALGTVELRRATQITLENDTVIRMNIYHPLYTQDGWKSITRYNGLPELTIEDKLLNSEGEYIGIKSIENVVIDEATYYTLKVEGNNNFYINGILAQGKDKD